MINRTINILFVLVLIILAIQNSGYCAEAKVHTNHYYPEQLYVDRSEYELADQESVLDIAADLFLKSMKVFVDYLEGGGDPAAYKKKFSAIRKAQI